MPMTPQPNHPEKHNQDTSPKVTGPTTSTTRSHDKQVPFSRQTSTVLASNKYRSHGRAGSGPYQPPPCPYQERPDSQAPGVLGALVGGLPVPGPPSPAPGSQRAVRLLGLGEP